MVDNLQIVQFLYSGFTALILHSVPHMTRVYQVTLIYHVVLVYSLCTVMLASIACVGKEKVVMNHCFECRHGYLENEIAALTLWNSCKRREHVPMEGWLEILWPVYTHTHVLERMAHEEREPNHLSPLGCKGIWNHQMKKAWWYSRCLWHLLVSNNYWLLLDGQEFKLVWNLLCRHFDEKGAKRIEMVASN